jgi:hypothetical protein
VMRPLAPGGRGRPGQIDHGADAVTDSGVTSRASRSCHGCRTRRTKPGTSRCRHASRRDACPGN